MAKHRVWGVGVLCVLLFGGIARAQVSTGTISGTVKDSSGAVLPGAKVVILNEGTGISRTVEADSDGHYSALSLSVGSYRVTVTREGFQTQVRTGIVLTVGREEVVDMSLTVGSVAQSVVVTGAPPLVESTTASLGSLVDDQTIRSLPLNGRSWDQLALLQPGVTLTNPGPPVNNQFNYGTGKRFSVGGQRPNTNLFLLDATDMSDQANGTPGGAAGTNLGVDTILEFKIFTNSFKAEYGHSMGSVTTAVTRSGTNTLHGTAFEYIRNHVLDAKNFFDVDEPPPFIRNQFGGVLGGPIKKDKTFFFAGYEGLRQGLGTTLIATVPNANSRQGIVPCGSVTPLPAGCPVGGTTLVTVPINPVVVPYLNLYPLPNGRDFGDGSAQFLSSPTAVTNEDNVMGRVDHQLTANTAIFARYTFDQDSVTTPQNLPFEFTSNTNRRQYFTVQANTVLTSQALNNFRFAYDRTRSDASFSYTDAVTPDLSFIPNEPMGLIQLGAIGSSSGSSRALTPLGTTNGNGPFAWHPFSIFQWGDDFTYVTGKHSLKTGVNIERITDDYTNGGAQWGSYTFPTYTAFLQGKSSNLSVNGPLGKTLVFGYRQTLWAWYGQDDYKVTSRLTLNLGLRWEATSDPYSNGNTVILASLADTTTSASSHFFHFPKKSFEPRVGLAWQLTGSGKTVLRAGAGIYHNQILPWFYQTYTKLPPVSTLFSATNPPFPNGVTVLAQSKLALTAMAPTQKIPVNYQYNLSLQQEIFKNTMIQVAYAGNRASQLLTEIEGDTPNPTICSTALNNCPAGVPDGAPFYPLGAPRRNTAWNGIRYYQSNGQSQYDSVTATLRHQSSNGFQAQIFYTFSKSLDNSSTESPSESLRSAQSIMYPQDYGLDWGKSDFNAKHTAVGYFSYPLPFRADSKALATIANGWKLDGIFTATSGLPLTPLLATSNSRNLSTAGIADRPNLNPGFSNNPSHGISAGCTGFAAGTPVGNARNWFDPCAFSLPIAGTYGDMLRNTVIGPGIVSLDVAMEKDFKVNERASVTFRAEAFNIINHANFGLPNPTALTSTGAANASAGVITYTVTSSRQLQFALRVNF